MLLLLLVPRLDQPEWRLDDVVVVAVAVVVVVVVVIAVVAVPICAREIQRLLEHTRFPRVVDPEPNWKMS